MALKRHPQRLDRGALQPTLKLSIIPLAGQQAKMDGQTVISGFSAVGRALRATDERMISGCPWGSGSANGYRAKRTILLATLRMNDMVAPMVLNGGLVRSLCDTDPHTGASTCQHHNLGQIVEPRKRLGVRQVRCGRRNMRILPPQNRSDRRVLLEIDCSDCVWLRGQDLNLRPSGYEPDELPDCSTPRQIPTRSLDANMGRITKGRRAE
jgi:hypothetical protein